jgi:urease alpha subunit
VTFPFGVTVTLLTSTISGVDADGNDVFGSTPLTIEGCDFSPGTSTEILGSQDTVISQPTVWFPVGAAIPQAIDKVIVQGVTYDIDGGPNVTTNPWTGWTPGPFVKLKAVTG